MANVMVCTGLAGSPEGQGFCEILGEDDRACWHLVELWGKGLDTNNVRGILPAHLAKNRARVAQLAGYLGDPELMWEALTTPLGPEQLCWLVEQEDGSWYMRGWSRQKRFFKERERLRKVAEKRRRERDAQRDAIEEAERALEEENEAITDGTRADTRADTRAGRSGTRGIRSRSRLREDLDNPGKSRIGPQRVGQAPSEEPFCEPEDPVALASLVEATVLKLERGSSG